MSNEQSFSDEYLNSFVDNELTIEEKSRVYITIHQDETLSRRVCELRKIHDVIQLAYKDLPPPSTRSLPRKSARLGRGVAAGLVFALGVLFSWFQFSPSTGTLRHDLQNAADSLVTRVVAVFTPGTPAPSRTQGGHAMQVVADAGTRGDHHQRPGAEPVAGESLALPGAGQPDAEALPQPDIRRLSEHHG